MMKASPPLVVQVCMDMLSAVIYSTLNTSMGSGSYCTSLHHDPQQAAGCNLTSWELEHHHSGMQVGGIVRNVFLLHAGLHICPKA